jgi:cytoskeletal protein CcmA (bactofilin family)
MALFTKESPPVRAPGRADSAPLPTVTFFGPSVVFEGKLTGNEPVTIEGTVRGEINLSAELVIGPRGRVEATVHAKTVIIEGKLTGDVSGDEKVELIASATVDGNIKAPKIVVAEGAKFRGSVDMGSPRPKDQADAPVAKAK